MPGPLVAGIAGSVGSAIIQKKSADKAAGAQSKAADAQIAEAQRQFDLIQGLLKPYVTAGNSGLQAQLDLLGLGGSAGKVQKVTKFTDTVVGEPRRGPDGRVIPGSGGPMEITKFKVGDQVFGSKDAALQYAKENPIGKINAQDAQRAAIDKISGGEQFGQLVKQGEYAMMANASATGGLRGGDQQAAMAQFRPQMLQALIDKQLANFGGLAANGQNAAAMTGTAAQNTGAQIGAALGDKGAAGAGAALAGGQAWANAGAGVLNTIGSLAGPTQPGGGLWQKWSF